LCGFKEFGKRASIITGSKGPNDKALAVAIRDRLEGYDLLVTFNGLNYDVPFLNSRLLFHNERPLKPMLHVDLYRVAKRLFSKMSRKSLANLSSYMHLGVKHNVLSETWLNGSLGYDKRSIDEIARHCRKDVAITERLFHKLKGAIKSVQRV
jgi:uncharacterized protein YprB with RNaseH-like and TPR domain